MKVDLVALALVLVLVPQRVAGSARRGARLELDRCTVETSGDSTLKSSCCITACGVDVAAQEAKITSLEARLQEVTAALSARMLNLEQTVHVPPWSPSPPDPPPPPPGSPPHSHSPHSHGPHSHGPHSHGPHSHSPHSHSHHHSPSCCGENGRCCGVGCCGGCCPDGGERRKLGPNPKVPALTTPAAVSSDDAAFVRTLLADLSSRAPARRAGDTPGNVATLATTMRDLTLYPPEARLTMAAVQMLRSTKGGATTVMRLDELSLTELRHGDALLERFEEVVDEHGISHAECRPVCGREWVVIGRWAVDYLKSLSATVE